MNKQAIIGGAIGGAIWVGAITFSGWGFDPASWLPENRLAFIAILGIAIALGAEVTKPWFRK